MLRPKAVSAYLADHSLVGDDLIHRIDELRDEQGNIDDFRETLNRYATECRFCPCLGPGAVKVISYAQLS